MPKMKTKRSAAKRVRVSASGKIRVKHPYHSHILTKKTTKRKRKLRHSKIANPINQKQLKKLLPYL